MFDIKKIQEEAAKEVREDREKAAKAKIKTQMEKIAKAKSVLRGLEQELELLMEAIGNEL